jgi:uncharacterized protein involved in exopolysaccharide biosynthesis
VGASLAVAIGYGVLGADHYKAVATLLIDPSPFDTRSVNASPTAPRGTDLDLLRSERVAQRVVENERLVEEPALRHLYLQSIDAGRPPLEALAQFIADHVAAAGSDDGGLVRLAATLGEPQLAARVANAYAQAWGEVSLELRANAIRSGLERAHEDLVSLRARLGEARARLNGGDALAAAGSHADEQFAQLSRNATRALDPAAALPDAASGSAEAGMHGVSASLPAAALPPEANTLVLPSTSRGDAAASTADDEIRIAQQSLERAEDRLARLAAEGIGAPFPAHVLRPAAVPQSSTKPGLGFCAGLGLAIGLGLGLMAMLLGERLDRRVRRPADLTRSTGIVVLGNLPAVHVPAGVVSGARPGASALRLRGAGNGAY